MNDKEIIFWEYERDGEMSDGEYDTRQKAQEAADDAFMYECLEHRPEDGASFEEEIELVAIGECPTTGERYIVHRHLSSVDYEHEEDDYTHHNTFFGGI